MMMRSVTLAIFSRAKIVLRSLVGRISSSSKMVITVVSLISPSSSPFPTRHDIKTNRTYSSVLCSNSVLVAKAAAVVVVVVGAWKDVA